MRSGAFVVRGHIGQSPGLLTVLDDVVQRDVGFRTSEVEDRGDEPAVRLAEDGSAI